MKKLTLEISRVTEAAAIAASPQIGRGQKEKADEKAVEAMKIILNQIEFDGEIVIGEGEIDDAPMLYNGEKVGLGGKKIDIAVDPIDGTRMVAKGQASAVSVIVFGEKDSLLRAPDMYMEKIMVNQFGRGSIDIDADLKTNLQNLAKKLNKDLTQLTVITLDKPRHQKQIKLMQEIGVKVIAIPDGDVEGSILVAMPDEEVDMFYGIGGAPEGVISASIIRSLGGDMQGRLLDRVEVKGKTADNIEFAKIEHAKCQELKLVIGQKINLDQLAKSNKVLISMTGITDGQLLKGVRMKNGIAKTETLLIRGSSKTIRIINATHQISNKEEKLQKLIGAE